MSGYKSSGGNAVGGYIEFPKMVYHSGTGKDKKEPKIVNSQVELDALGSEWSESKRDAIVEVGEIVKPEYFVSYPKWKYHKEGASQVVQDSNEEVNLGDGWYDTPALAKKAAENPSIDPDAELEGLDTDQLREIAVGLGIDVKGTWGSKRLIQAIEEEKLKVA